MGLELVASTLGKVLMRMGCVGRVVLGCQLVLGCLLVLVEWFGLSVGTG